MTNQNVFRGSMPALISPMTADGEVDRDAFQRFVNWQVEQGSHGLVPVGTTGESPTLAHEEHKLLVRLCVEAADGRVPVMAGAGSNSTREALALAEDAERSGADALLIVTPYYNKPNAAGQIAHFTAIHDAKSLPIFIYNIPGRSVIDMTEDTMAALFALPRIVGLKDATGDLARVARQRTLVGKDFIQLSGEDATAVGFNAMGGQGCISVTANIAPALCSQMQEASLAGDTATAQSIQDQLIGLHDLMFCEPSPAPVKYAAFRLGICENRVRMPLVPFSEDGMAALDAKMHELGLVGLG